MSEYLPQAVRLELGVVPDRGRVQPRTGAEEAPTPLRLVANGVEYPVLRRWESGFAIASENVPGLRGRVDLYEGSRLVCKALVVASGEEAGERTFEFKYRSEGRSIAPPADFARMSDFDTAV